MEIKQILKIGVVLVILFVVILIIPKLFPQIFYSNKTKYKNYVIYSNNYIDSSINQILDSVIQLTNNKILPQANVKYNIFLCNSDLLMRLGTTMLSVPTGASDFISNNIYLSHADIKRNFATNKEGSTFGRTIQSVIAHEQTHILIREKRGKLSYFRLYIKEPWKIEGICEWIAFYGLPVDTKSMQDVIKSGSYKHNVFHQYWINRYVVNYLIMNKKYSIDNVLELKVPFESIVNEIALRSPEAINANHSSNK